MGGAPVEHAEHWKVLEVVEFALKYATLTFRKRFNSNIKINVLQRLKDVIHSMRPVIEGQTQTNTEAVKWYLLRNMNFCKSTSPGIKTDLAAMFHSEVFKNPLTPTNSITNFTYDITKLCSRLMNFKAVVVVGL